MAHDHESVPLNKIIPYKEIGMPYHGLATDGILPTSDGDKTIHTPAIYGACQVVRHPLAPGATRNTEQLARDTAKGYEWRDYALLTGPNHGLNGSQTELGSAQWLYCDAAGNTWVLSAAQYETGIEPPPVTHEGIAVDHIGTPVTHTGTLQNSQMEFYIWLEAIFGRYGKPYPFTRRFVTSLVWSPTIPTWYSGSYSASDVVQRTIFKPESLVIEPDGASVFIHLFCDDSDLNGALNRDLYPETQPDAYTDSPVGFSMIGILRVDVTGNGDLNDNGVGINAALTKHYDYEDDIVISRNRWFNDSQGNFGTFNNVVALNEPPPPATGAPPLIETTWNKTYQHNWDGDPTGYDSRSGWDYDAILYLTFDGDVRRRYQRDTRRDWARDRFNNAQDVYNLDNQFSATPVLAYPANPDWFLVDCSESGHIWTETHLYPTDEVRMDYTILGQVYSYHYLKRTDDFDTIEHAYTQSQHQVYTCGGRPALGITPYETTTWTLNGQAISGDSTLWHDFRVIAPNLFYVALDYPQTDVSQRTMDERIVGLNDSGVATEIYNKQTTHAPLATVRKIPDARELVWSYQPVTEESVHNTITIGLGYSGPLYQYV